MLTRIFVLTDESKFIISCSSSTNRWFSNALNMHFLKLRACVLFITLCLMTIVEVSCFGEVFAFNRTAVLYDSVTLGCAHYDNLRYQWYKGHVNDRNSLIAGYDKLASTLYINDNYTSKVDLSETGLFTFLRTELNDDSVYTCYDRGVLLSTTYLEVISIPDKAVIVNEGETFKPYITAKLVCMIEGVLPRPTPDIFYWKNDDQKLNNAYLGNIKRTDGLFDSVLMLILDITPEDEGKLFRCNYLYNRDGSLHTKIETTTLRVSSSDEPVDGTTRPTSLIAAFVSVVIVLLVVVLILIIIVCRYRRNLNGLKKATAHPERTYYNERVTSSSYQNVNESTVPSSTTEDNIGTMTENPNRDYYEEIGRPRNYNI